jgi:hypothetical protein
LGTGDGVSKSILYYTCLTHPFGIEIVCRRQLAKAGLYIVAVSRDEVINFGDTRTVVHGERSPETMHRQIVEGLKLCPTDHVFLCESDVLYHPSHFDFSPERDDTFYFNTNVYKRWQDGLIVWTDDLQQISGICASRKLLLDFFTNRLEQIQKDGFNRHYEPGKRYGCRVENWQSPVPNIDIRHGKTLTKSHRSVDEFRNPKFAKGFRVVESVPGWESN